MTSVAAMSLPEIRLSKNSIHQVAQPWEVADWLMICLVLTDVLSEDPKATALGNGLRLAGWTSCRPQRLELGENYVCSFPRSLLSKGLW